jgi:hypothetical protein
MLAPVIEIAEVEGCWSVRWEERIKATFPNVAAAVRYAQKLSTGGDQPPRVRVYFTSAMDTP